MLRSPSANTLNLLDRETYTLWKRPIWTIIYCFMEIITLLKEFLLRFFFRLIISHI